MRKKIIIISSMVIVIAAAVCAIILTNKSGKQPAEPKPAQQTASVSTKGEETMINEDAIPVLFEGRNGTYNYCPSIIQTDENTRYIYYCANKDSKVIKDYVYMRKGTKSGDKWNWTDEKIVLEPSELGWDEVHVCDPDVIGGEYKYKGETYNYMMAYLACKTYDNTRNETGVAFAKSPEGPWVKYDKNPVVSYDSEKDGVFWGVGQPSLLSMDKKGGVLMFYTRGDKYGTRGVTREMDLNNADNPVIGEEIELPIDGLSEIDKSQVVMSNFKIARNASTGELIGVRDRHPYGPSLPDIIASELQVFKGSPEIVYNPEGKWTTVADIGEFETGYPRNHNAGIVTDIYGNLVSDKEVEVVFTSCQLGAHSQTLWTYRLHGYTVNLK